MIRVFVFVSGISLAQFSSVPGDPTIVLMATGAGHFREFHAVHEPHTVKMEQGSPRRPIQLSTKLPVAVVELNAPCVGDPCAVIAAPDRIADLNDLLRRDVRVKLDCLEPAGAFEVASVAGTLHERCVASSTDYSPANAAGTGNQPLVNTYVRIKGDWTAVPTIDCYGKLEGPRAKLLTAAFLRSTASWDGRYPDGEEIGNSIVFFADIPDDPNGAAMESVLRINGDSVALQVIDGANGDDLCGRLGGYGAPTKCAVVTLRNYSESNTYQGGGDPHFAALYSLVESRPNGNQAWGSIALDQAWLPIAVGPQVCKEGGGCCRLSGCVGTKVKK